MINLCFLSNGQVGNRTHGIVPARLRDGVRPDQDRIVIYVRTSEAGKSNVGLVIDIQMRWLRIVSRIRIGEKVVCINAASPLVDEC